MKIKIPKLSKFLPRRSKKLRASTARRPLRIAATADYDEMAEPNMKLSRALLIVLVLHVVAVSGIIAFNAIKTRQGSNSIAAPPQTSSPTSSTAKADNSTTRTASKETFRHEDTKPARTPAKNAKEEKKPDRTKTANGGDSSRTYTVVKGDTPVTIAKKLKVSYDELLALNHIEDPRKLQIGQKLLIPSKSTKGKKGDE